MNLHTLRIARPMFAVVALLLLPVHASAQAAGSNPGSIKFSVAGGLNVSRLSLPTVPLEELEGLIDISEVSIEEGWRTGLAAGVIADISLTPRMGLMTGGLFSMRGGKLNVRIPDLGTLSADFQMNYIDIPVLLSGRVWGTRDCSLSLLGGGMIGLKLHARIKISALGESENEEFTDEIPAADFGVAFGVRFDRGRAYVSSYYNHGLTNTGDDDDEPIKHRVWTTIAGWRF